MKVCKLLMKVCILLLKVCELLIKCVNCLLLMVCECYEGLRRKKEMKYKVLIGQNKRQLL